MKSVLWTKNIRQQTLNGMSPHCVADEKRNGVRLGYSLGDLVSFCVWRNFRFPTPTFTKPLTLAKVAL